MSEVIYEKKYPTVIEELEEIQKEHKPDEQDDLKPFDEFMRDIATSTTKILLPGRVRGVKQFISKAIDLSVLYEVDIEITKHDSFVTADLSFDSAGCMGFLISLVSMADDICFFAGIRGREITMSLDYYTHAEVRNGRVVVPTDWD